MKLFSEKLQLNKSDKVVLFDPQSKEEFLDILKEFLNNLHIKEYEKYIKNEEDLPTKLNYGNYHSFIQALKFHNKNNIINTYSWMAMEDLITILKYENYIKEDNEILMKFYNDKDFCKEVTKYCQDIVDDR